MNMRFFSIVGLIAIVGLFRLMPHPPNFTPILAMALFAGAYISDRRLALLIPLMAMVLSDMIIGFHATLFFVYAGIAGIVFAGWWLLQNKSIARVFTVSVFSTLLFFLVSNFGAWLALPELYARTIGGLVACYIAAIPFYHNSLFATLFFVGLLFGAMHYLERFYLLSAERGTRGKAG